MAKSKQLVCLDEICNDILKEYPNKSEYIREAIIFFENSKKQIGSAKATAPQPTITEIH